MPDRTAGRNRLCRRDDGIGVDAVMPVKLAKRSGLSEVLNTERPYPMAGHRTQPCQRRGMPVEDGDHPAIRRYVSEQPLDVRARVYKATFARALCCRPTCVEPVRGRDCQ